MTIISLIGLVFLFYVITNALQKKQKPQPMSPRPPAPVVPRLTVAAPPPPKAAPSANPYDAGETIGLSKEELLERAKSLRFTWNGFFGRRDMIPPTTDERTRLVDEGLITYGYMTREALAETHEVGDLWLKYHPKMVGEAVLKKQLSDAAIEKRREEKKALKAQKKEEARVRAEERKKAIALRRATDIVFLGRDVSAGLNDRRSHNEKLATYGLPILSTPADVAQALGMTIPQLRWLCFHRATTAKTHYAYTQIPKRSGGLRLISSPKPKLRAAQTWVLDNVLRPLEKHVSTHAHGFVTGRSTVTNARAHLRRHVVVNLDLSNFFPSIHFVRVRGLFAKLGYSPTVATILALLCTESPRRRIELDGISYWSAVAPRGLPQGACTSPLLSNIIVRTLDKRLAARAQKLGFTYTRYADDLTFSADDKSANVGKLMAAARHAARDEGFALNEKKGRVLRRHRRQSVTGVVVNERLSAPRDEMRQIRAILHKAKTTGLEAQNRDKHPSFEAYLRGKIAYFAMIDRAKAERLMSALDATMSDELSSRTSLPSSR